MSNCFKPSKGRLKVPRIPDDGVIIDISPGAFGNNSLSANDGQGHPLNPVTGQPYAPNLIKRVDFARVLAEYWADGPNSETPPGHWNSIANQESDHPAFQKRLAGTGPVLDDLDSIRSRAGSGDPGHGKHALVDPAPAGHGVRALLPSGRSVNAIELIREETI